MEKLKLTFVNVGYGEAAVLECPDPAFPGGTFVMVIDGGSAEAEELPGLALALALRSYADRLACQRILELLRERRPQPEKNRK